MSAFSAPKGASGASKGRYTQVNINSVFAGKAPHSSKASGPTKHGLQTLGKQSGAVRRMPPPATLPSLRAESAGQDPNVALVPQGGAGWGSQSQTAPERPQSPPDFKRLPSSQIESANGYAKINQDGRNVHGTVNKTLASSGPDLRPKWAKNESATVEQLSQMQSATSNSRDFPSLSAAAVKSTPTSEGVASLKPQKSGSWKSGGGGAMSKWKEKGEENDEGDGQEEKWNRAAEGEAVRVEPPSRYYGGYCPPPSHHYAPPPFQIPYAPTHTGGDYGNQQTGGVYHIPRHMRPPSLPAGVPPRMPIYDMPPPQALRRYNVDYGGQQQPVMGHISSGGRYDMTIERHSSPIRNGFYPTAGEYRRQPLLPPPIPERDRYREEKGMWSDEEDGRRLAKPPMTRSPYPQEMAYEDERAGGQADWYHSQYYDRSQVPSWHGRPPQHYPARPQNNLYNKQPMPVYENVPLSSVDVDEEEADDERLQRQQTMEREAAIERSRQKRRLAHQGSNAMDGPSFDGARGSYEEEEVANENERPSSRDSLGKNPLRRHDLPPRFQHRHRDKPRPDDESVADRNRDNRIGDTSTNSKYSVRRVKQLSREEIDESVEKERDRAAGYRVLKRPDSKDSAVGSVQADMNDTAGNKQSPAAPAYEQEDDDENQLTKLSRPSTKVIKRVVAAKTAKTGVSHSDDRKETEDRKTVEQKDVLDDAGAEHSSSSRTENVWEKRIEQRQSAERHKASVVLQQQQQHKEIRIESDKQNTRTVDKAKFSRTSSNKEPEQIQNRRAGARDDWQSQPFRGNREFVNSRRTRGVSLRGRGRVQTGSGRTRESSQQLPVPRRPQPVIRDNFANMGQFRADENGQIIEEDDIGTASRDGKETGRTEKYRSGRQSRATAAARGSSRGRHQPYIDQRNFHSYNQYQSVYYRQEERGESRSGYGSRASGGRRGEGNRMVPSGRGRGRKETETPATRRGRRTDELSRGIRVKSPVTSEGHDQWETASESSDIALRRPPPSHQPTASGRKQSQRFSQQRRERQQVQQQQQSSPKKEERTGQKNVTPASQPDQQPRLVSRMRKAEVLDGNDSGTCKSDGLAGVDINNAGVIVIDDRPDNAVGMEKGFEDFEEVVSKKEKKARLHRQMEIHEKEEKRRLQKEKDKQETIRRRKDGSQRDRKPRKVSEEEMVVAAGQVLVWTSSSISATSQSGQANIPPASVESTLASDSTVDQTLLAPGPIARPARMSSVNKQQLMSAKTDIAIWTSPDPSSFSSTDQDTSCPTIDQDALRPCAAKSAELPVSFDMKPVALEAATDLQTVDGQMPVVVEAPTDIQAEDDKADDDQLKEKLDMVKDIWPGEDEALVSSAVSLLVSQQLADSAVIVPEKSSLAQGPNVATVRPQPQSSETGPGLVLAPTKAVSERAPVHPPQPVMAIPFSTSNSVASQSFQVPVSSSQPLSNPQMQPMSVMQTATQSMSNNISDQQSHQTEQPMLQQPSRPPPSWSTATPNIDFISLAPNPALNTTIPFQTHRQPSIR